MRRVRDHIVFVSTTAGWGGSEELWSQAALDLQDRGFAVHASITERSPLHARALYLKSRGIELRTHRHWYSWRSHPWHRLRSHNIDGLTYSVDRLITSTKPALVVFSEGGAHPVLELIEMCAAKNVPFVTIVQSNRDDAWQPDERASRYRAVLSAARRCFFVSQANRRLAEKQIGAELINAEVVWNPVNVRVEALPPWPSLSVDHDLRLACVARLHPPSKGQDILFEALAMPPWKARSWRLGLYGEGNMRVGLERYAARLGISDRVSFAGFQAVEKIWAENHALVMPSRYEGLPLAIVEAMFCARPVIATDVAGHPEVIADGITGFLAAPTPAAIATALERFWTERASARDMGTAGARRIRELVPSNPVRMFSDKLVKYSKNAASSCAVLAEQRV